MIKSIQKNRIRLSLFKVLIIILFLDDDGDNLTLWQELMKNWTPDLTDLL